MKKIISLALSFVMLLSVTIGLNLTAYADDELSASGSCGDNVTYTFDESTGLLTISGTGDMTDYKQSASPFYGRKDILSVTVNEGITSIGNNAFYATGITSANIPNSTTRIGTHSFYYCKSLTGVIIPENVTTIESGAFEACTGLISLTIGKNVETIGNNAFFNCYGLTGVTIPNSVKSIGAGAFNACTAMTSLTIGNSVTTIGNSAFYYCKELTNITLPDSLTIIGNNAFSGCEKLKSINIPDNVTSIGNSAFFSCLSLTDIELPDDLTSISDRCFYACSALESVSIPSSVNVIEDMAFYNCNALKDIYYSSTVADWNTIDIVSGKYQGDLFVRNATIHCTDGLAHCRHTNTYVKKENIKGVTVSEKGSYDKVIYCCDCGVEMWRERVDVEVSAPALIVHWSSIDGVDLVEPVVFENVNADSTVSEVLENAGRQPYQKFFAEDKYTEMGMLYTKPMSEYSELGNKLDYVKLMQIDSETRSTKIGENGLDIYTAEYKVITDDVVAEIQNPVCGTSTTTPKDENGEWLYEEQTNMPRVTLPENSHCRIMGEYELGKQIVPWVTDPSNIYSDPYIGTFEGGETYYAQLFVVAEYGYLFHNEASSLTVNGTPVANATGNRTAVIGTVPLTAEHNVVTDNAVAPTCAKSGKTEGSHCAACGKVFTEQTVVPATGAHKYTSKIIEATAKTYTKEFTCKECGKTYTQTYNKMKNTLAAKGKTVTVKLAKITKKNQTIAAKKAFAVSKAQGKVTYKKASGNKKIAVAKNGRLTVKKGLKKGKYKVKVKVTAAGSTTCKAATKTVTVTIIVK